MKKGKFLDMIIFFFENACTKTTKRGEEELINKVRNFLLSLDPEKIWEEKGLINKRLKKNVFPDFVILLNGKLIACEVERTSLKSKFDLYNGIKLFDEIWFFTDIPYEKKWLHYKFENQLKIKQKFFGIDRKNKIVLIKEIY